MDVVQASTGRDLDRFVSLPWEIYRGDPLWVPPLRREAGRMLSSRHNPLLQSGPHVFFLALQDERPAGRLCAGIDLKFNAAKGREDGYFCLFESVDDYDVARALFDRAAKYLGSLGMAGLRGPISPTNGDEYRGLMVHGFDRRPVLFQAYNPAYYAAFFDRYGFSKELDYFAYRYDPASSRDRSRVVEYAMRRYHFRTDAVDWSNLERDLADAWRVMDQAIPNGLAGPRCSRHGSSKAHGDGSEAVRRSGAGQNRAMREPADWLPGGDAGLQPGAGENEWEALSHGVVDLPPDAQEDRRHPRLHSLRNTEYQRKRVIEALYHAVAREALARGYTWGEGSAVLETNLPMRKENERLGGVHRRTYRIYRKQIS